MVTLPSEAAHAPAQSRLIKNLWQWAEEPCLSSTSARDASPGHALTARPTPPEPRPALSRLDTRSCADTPSWSACALSHGRSRARSLLGLLCPSLPTGSPRQGPWVSEAGLQSKAPRPPPVRPRPSTRAGPLVPGAQVSPPAAPSPTAGPLCGGPKPRGRPALCDLVEVTSLASPARAETAGVRTDESPHLRSISSPGRTPVCGTSALDRLGRAHPSRRRAAGAAAGSPEGGRPRTCCVLLWDCRLDWSRRSSGAPFLDSLLSSQ